MSGFAVTPRTVIEACFDPDGIAQLDNVYDIAMAVGLGDQSVRLAIRRLEAAGILRQEGRGRKGRLILTADGLRQGEVDARYVAMAYKLDRGQLPWDGLWRLYTFSVPELHRTERDAIRNALTYLGAAPLGPGVYVSPYDLIENIIEETSPEIADGYLISAEVSRLSGPGFADSKAIAEKLWPSIASIEMYEPVAELLQRKDYRRPELSPIELVAQALGLAEAFSCALARDPLLPAELRPDNWQPAQIRSEFAQVWNEIRQRGPEITLFEVRGTRSRS